MAFSEHLPDYEQFRDDIKKINPDGDLVKTYGRLKYYIEIERTCTDGTSITYKLVMDKFAAHIKQWNARYGSRDIKFIGKAEEDKKKNLFDFLGLKMYEREFVMATGSSERDDYLFGGFSKSYLKKQIMEFDNKLVHEE